jgi:hypothetical protein
MTEPILAPEKLSRWTRFWHVPVRAERLALMRILLALALLSELLFQYRPNLDEFFGPHGVAPSGLHDADQLRHWRWTQLFFYTDDMTVIRTFFWIWVLVTSLWLVGFRTRLMNLFVWFLTLMFIQRNGTILNGGDDTLQVGVFLLMLAPTGRALSIDAWLRHRRTGTTGPDYTPAWPVRVLQIQLALIYLTTGLAKLIGECKLDENGLLLAGTWWEGSSIHFVLNYVIMSRWSFAQMPLPVWLTAIMSYTCLAFEIFFFLLVLNRRLRPWVLLFGLLFHLGIWLTVEVGWFSFYTVAFYGVWVPCTFWDRRRPGNVIATAQPARTQLAPAKELLPAAG